MSPDAANVSTSTLEVTTHPGRTVRVRGVAPQVWPMVRKRSESGALNQPQVFVSYARQDSDRVHDIVRLLEQAGVTVWRDCDRILGGQYYGEQIVHAIAHSRVVLLMCSAHAFQSDNVHREVLLTWDYHRRFIPVWLCPPLKVLSAISTVWWAVNGLTPTQSRRSDGCRNSWSVQNGWSRQSSRVAISAG